MNREREIEARFWEGDILAIKRAEYPESSKFRRGTLEWLEGESVGIRLDANDSLEQFALEDCTLIARGEKYHYEQKIAALDARVRELTRERDAAREALRPVTDAVWDVRRLWNETLINFADAVGLDLDQYMELATDEQRAKWTIIHDMLFRMANPHLQAGDAAALAGNGER